MHTDEKSAALEHYTRQAALALRPRTEAEMRDELLFAELDIEGGDIDQACADYALEELLTTPAVLAQRLADDANLERDSIDDERMARRRDWVNWTTGQCLVILLRDSGTARAAAIDRLRMLAARGLHAMAAERGAELAAQYRRRLADAELSAKQEAA